MCIDDMINKLEEYRMKYGGSTEVITRSIFGGLVEPSVGMVALPRGRVSVVILPKD